MQRPLLNKIIWQSSNYWQIAGALMGLYLGLCLLLGAFQLYLDINQLLGGGTDKNGEYVQINKKVNIFNTLGVKSSFSPEELETIKNQPFILAYGAFEANQYEAGAYSDMLGFYTELFFESVPEEFIDVDEPAFRWSEGRGQLPVLMSKEYLALYNFGYAPGRGLPQLSPNTIGRFSLDIKISGNGMVETYTGKVVGFSERINSILVPRSFMQWANERFADGSPPPSKLILQVKNPMSNDFQNFLKTNGYELSAGKLIGGQFGVLFKLVMASIAGLGMMILVLAILVFSLNFQLLIARATQEITLLLQLGYKSKTISDILDRRFILLFGTAALSAFATVYGLRYALVHYFNNQGFELTKALDWRVWATGVLLSALFLGIHVTAARRSILKLA